MPHMIDYSSPEAFWNSVREFSPVTEELSDHAVYLASLAFDARLEADAATAEIEADPDSDEISEHMCVINVYRGEFQAFKHAADTIIERIVVIIHGEDCPDAECDMEDRLRAAVLDIASQLCASQRQ